jgi:hypothetical protein
VLAFLFFFAKIISGGDKHGEKESEDEGSKEKSRDKKEGREKEKKIR